MECEHNTSGAKSIHKVIKFDGNGSAYQAQQPAAPDMRRPGKRYFTTVTDSAILFLPLISQFTDTFSPTLRPGFLNVFANWKAEPS